MSATIKDIRFEPITFTEMSASNVSGGASRYVKSRDLLIDTIRVYVPNRFIGAVIGYKGSYIKLLQAATTTGIRVEPIAFAAISSKNAVSSVDKSKIGAHKNVSKTPVTSVDDYGSVLAEKAVLDGLSAVCMNTYSVEEKEEENGKNVQINDVADRRVHVTGTYKNVMKAMFWLFQRVAEVEEVKMSTAVLHVEFNIPDAIVGHVIGRNGQNIAQLKRISKGCDVHVTSMHDGSDANVCMYGAYGPCLTVMCRINDLRICEMISEGKLGIDDNNNPLPKCNFTANSTDSDDNTSDY